MKCPLNVDVRAKKTLSIGFVVLLLLIMAVGVSATPWDGTPDDITPSQAIWVDPKNTTVLDMGDIFTVDVLVNITDPPGAATGLWGWQYVLEWNSTILEVVEVQTHGDKVPSGDLLPGHTNVMVADNTTTASNHTYVVVPMGGVAFTGVDSLCTYKFKVIGEGSCALDLIETGKFQVKLTDDAAKVFVQGTPPIGTIVDGYFIVPYPTASFTYSPSYPDVNERVTFNASSSFDLDGEIVSYEWDFDDGTKEIYVGANLTDTATHNYTAAGTYNVTLKVTDNESKTGTTWNTVRVAGPVAIFSCTSIPSERLVNKLLTFDASDSEGEIVSYEWDFDDGTKEIYVGANLTDTATHNYTAVGTYNVTLKVTDNETLTDLTSTLITVLAKPVANFAWSPETPEVSETVTFNASASYDPGGDITLYNWDFGDGSTSVDTLDPIITHNYATAGIYSVTLKVTDNDPLPRHHATTVKNITIAKASSTISISASPTTIEVGENTTISGSITPNPGAHAAVTIHYRLTNEAWENLENVTTNSDGEYSYVWTPDEAGTYEVKASWPGEEDRFLGDESSPITITVEEAPEPEPEPTDYLPYAAIVIVVVLVAAIAIYFLKVRKS